MKTGYKVCDVMTNKPIVVAPTLSLEACAQMMNKHHVSTLVVKDSHKAAGIITEQDIVRKVVAKQISPKEPVKKFMETKLVTIAPEQDIYEALLLMKDHNIRHLPVMNGKKMIGLLTLKDVLRIQPQLFDLLVEKFELREAEAKLSLIPGNEGICELCGRYARDLSPQDGAHVCDTCRR